MTSLVDALAQEILDNIVDFAALCTPPTHSSNSLTALIGKSRHFQHRCRTHLYKDIQLAERGVQQYNNSHLRRTLDLLQAIPSISAYVKQLTIRYHLKDIDLEDLQDAWPDAQWVRRLVKRGQIVLRTLIDMFRNVEVIELIHQSTKFAQHRRLEHLLWDDMDKNLAKSLERIAERSGHSLKNLKIIGMQKVPLRFLVGLHALQNLTLGAGTTFYVTGSETNVVPWKLKALFAPCGTEVLSPHISIPSSAYSQLTHLRLLFIKPEHHRKGWNLIDAAAATLAALVIEYQPYHNFQQENMNVNKLHPSTKTFPHLQLISFAGTPLVPWLPSASTILSAAPQMLCAILHHCQLPKLRVLNIATNFPARLAHYQGAANTDLFAEKGLWADLASLMADTSRLPDLRAVGLLVGPQPTSDLFDNISEVQDDAATTFQRRMEQVFGDVKARSGVTFGLPAAIMKLPLYADLMKGFG